MYQYSVLGCQNDLNHQQVFNNGSRLISPDVLFNRSRFVQTESRFTWSMKSFRPRIEGVWIFLILKKASTNISISEDSQSGRNDFILRVKRLSVWAKWLQENNIGETTVILNNQSSVVLCHLGRKKLLFSTLHLGDLQTFIQYALHCRSFQKTLATGR